MLCLDERGVQPPGSRAGPRLVGDRDSIFRDGILKGSGCVYARSGACMHGGVGKVYVGDAEAYVALTQICQRGPRMRHRHCRDWRASASPPRPLLPQVLAFFEASQ